jgi:hypothetical protein
LDELEKGIEKATVLAVQTVPALRPSSNRYVLTREAPTPHIAIRNLRGQYGSNVFRSGNIRPVVFEYGVAKRINLTLENSPKSFALKT